MQKVTISILNYNNSKDTIECLNSLQKLELNDIKLSTFVLDNGSKENFKVDVLSYKDIDLEIISSDPNLGFTGGHNLVYKKAKEDGFDFFMILNNDCVLDTKCLIRLIEEIQGQVGAVVPKIYFTKGHEYHKSRYQKDELGRVIWYAGGKIDWENVVSVHIGLDEVDNGQFDTAAEVDFATGACVMFTSELLERVGLFDKRYFLYFEDADLSMRIIKAGYKISYVPKAVVWHNNAGSSGSGSELHDYYLTRNKLLFGTSYATFKMKLFLLKEAVAILTKGRKWQKKGVIDFFTGKLGKGSYE